MRIHPTVVTIVKPSQDLWLHAKAIILYMCCLKYAHEQQYTSANTNIVSAGSVLAFTDDQEPEELIFMCPDLPTSEERESGKCIVQHYCTSTEFGSRP